MPRAARRIGIEGLRTHRRERLARSERGLRELVEPRRHARGLHLGIRAERLSPLAQQQVVADACRCAVPHAFHVLGTRRLEVEVARALVATGLEDVHRPECAARIARAESKILVVARTVLPVQVDVKQLAVPERLGNPMREVQARHLLVPDLGIEADHLRMLELVDEGQRVSDGGQEDVATRLIRLGLDGEPHGVALLDDIRRENVERLLVAIERGANILCRAGLRTLTAAPEHDDSGAELGGEIEIVSNLAQRETPDVAVIRGERTVAKHRVREQVGRDHRHHQPGAVHRAAQAIDGRCSCQPLSR